jgi:hypothetical protein
MSLKSNVRLCALLLPLGLLGQEAAPSGAQAPVEQPSTQQIQPGTPASAAPDGAGIETGKRIFGVLPNYKTVEKMNSAYQPISTRTKFMIASKDSFDWPEFFVAGAMSGLNQMTEQNPEWGQGVKGYSKRYGASMADQIVSNYLTEAILPSVLHDDPRYFRLGQGSAAHRILHALSWVIISKTDSNHNTLNVPELLGSGASAAIGTMYYPADERTASSVRDRFVTQVSFDAASSVLKEYWPDIRQLLSRKRH